MVSAFAYGGSIGGSSLCLLLVWVLVLTAGNTAKGQYRALRWCEADMDKAGTNPTKAPWLLSVFIYECFRWCRVEIVSGIMRSKFPFLQPRPIDSANPFVYTSGGLVFVQVESYFFIVRGGSRKSLRVVLLVAKPTCHEAACCVSGAP